MDHVEPEEIAVYQPRPNVYISSAIGSEEDYGLFSVKYDGARVLLTDDDGHDVDYDVSNLEMHRRWTEENRAHAMLLFGVTEWEPDLTF